MSSDEQAPPGPASREDAIAAGGELQEPPAPAERISYLGFFLGLEVFGLPLEQLREVCKLTRVRRVPGAPPGVAGLVNLRGEIVCALDARAILGLPARPPGGEFLVALRGFPDPLGLVVDSIADIYAIDPADIAPPPAEWPPARAAFFTGTAQVREGFIGLLDLKSLVVSR
jgi:purine-binding chemotaxis protein CheW